MLRGVEEAGPARAPQQKHLILSPQASRQRTHLLAPAHVQKDCRGKEFLATRPLWPSSCAWLSVPVAPRLALCFQDPGSLDSPSLWALP